MIEKMARAVENASVVVACVTPGYSESRHCRTGKVDSFVKNDSSLSPPPPLSLFHLIVFFFLLLLFSCNLQRAM